MSRSTGKSIGDFLFTQFISKRFLSNKEDVLKENEIFECRELDKRINFKIKPRFIWMGLVIKTTFIFLKQSTND